MRITSICAAVFHKKEQDVHLLEGDLFDPQLLWSAMQGVLGRNSEAHIVFYERVWVCVQVPDEETGTL